jgi:hypothetical protein
MLCLASDDDAGDPKRSRNARKQEEFEDTFRTIENVAPIREFDNEISPEHGFQCVPESNAE